MTALAARLSPYLGRKFRLHHVLIALWMLAMIALPIMRWIYGDAALTPGVAVTVVLQAGAVLAILFNAWGARRTFITGLIIIFLGWLVEAVGSSTGIPFGVYHYTDQLQPQVAGVPLLIPIAWLMMMPPAWAAAQLIAGTRRTAFVVIAAVAMTAWDFFLDPQMVSWGFWVWEKAGGYFGIPWVNFAGWLVAAAFITLVANPRQVPARPLLLIYLITWIFETIGLLVFWGLPGPALGGFAAMGSVLFAAWIAGRWRGKTA